MLNFWKYVKSATSTKNHKKEILIFIGKHDVQSVYWIFFENAKLYSPLVYVVSMIFYSNSMCNT